MEKNSQRRWLARPTFADWAAAIPSTVVIVLACLWRDHSGVIQFEVFVVAILTGGWFAGPIPGGLIALLPILLFAYGVSHLNEPAASQMDLVVEWLLLFILGAGSGWLGARQRRLQGTIEQTRSELPAETRAGTEMLEKANAALKADIAKHKQTEFALRRSAFGDERGHIEGRFAIQQQ